ncbi:MAG TPA: DUF2344 domain-containing protein [Firmicutes bacterium]|nr:DUF2344 domain-containing protein [Bacillota bacterium]
MRIRARFTKEEPVRFISHLDLARTVERAVRRTGLPIMYTQGFNPRPKIAFGSALAVGITSSAEYVDMDFGCEVEVDEFLNAMNENLPAGIRFKEAKAFSSDAAPLMSVIDRAHYLISGEVMQAGVLSPIVERILDSGELWVDRPGKKQTRRINIRPWIFALEVLEEGAGRASLSLLVQTGSGGNVKPEEIAEQFPWAARQPRIHRCGLFIARGSELLSPLDVAHH